MSSELRDLPYLISRPMHQEKKDGDHARHAEQPLRRTWGRVGGIE